MAWQHRGTQLEAQQQRGAQPEQPWQPQGAQSDALSPQDSEAPAVNARRKPTAPQPQPHRHLPELMLRLAWQ
jgi:hypothetical protein